MPNSISPEVFEPGRRQFGVPDRVLDVLVSEIGLQRARIVTLVRQGEPARMPQHMWMRLETEFRLGACPFQNPAEPGGGERRVLTKKQLTTRRTRLRLMNTTINQLDNPVTPAG
jgi:hypothetical protein